MADLQIKRFTSRMLGANTYLIYRDKEGILVDPCTKVEIIREFCIKNEISINLVVMTHCHIDHTMYLKEYISEFKVKSAIHEDGIEYLCDADKNGSRLFGMNKAFEKPDIHLNETSTLKIGASALKVLHTPGHSPGSICLYTDNLVISGDTLFNMSIGRSDLPGGNPRKIEESLKKIADLPENTIVYPGHGTFTTIKFEKLNNPYLLNL